MSKLEKKIGHSRTHIFMCGCIFYHYASSVFPKIRLCVVYVGIFKFRHIYGKRHFNLRNSIIFRYVRLEQYNSALGCIGNRRNINLLFAYQTMAQICSKSTVNSKTHIPLKAICVFLFYPPI